MLLMRPCSTHFSKASQVSVKGGITLGPGFTDVGLHKVMGIEGCMQVDAKYPEAALVLAQIQAVWMHGDSVVKTPRQGKICAEVV